MKFLIENRMHYKPITCKTHLDHIRSWKNRLTTVVLYYISLLVPRCPHIWILGGWDGERYSDNSRYLFDYVVEHLPAIRARPDAAKRPGH